MTATIHINKRGSMTLPKELRRSLGLENGGTVMAESAENGILIRPAKTFPIEIYSEEQIGEFDAAEAELNKRLGRKAQAGGRVRRRA